jgi:hypothetical protein
MICTSSLYDACHELFANYPLATETADPAIPTSSITLMLQDRDDLVFFVLTRDCRTGAPVYELSPWGGGAALSVEADTGPGVPDIFVNAVRSGVPIPADGSLFGSRRTGFITALLAIYSAHDPGYTEPCWSVLPHADIPEPQWPTIPHDRFFGQWFWERYRAADIVPLADLIARTPGTVFWVDTTAVIGSGCCAVARDVVSHEGYTLRRGRYVHHTVLRAGKHVPSLDVLLADDNKTDLSPRF